MQFSILYDVAGPGTLIAGALFGLLSLIGLTLVITLIEAMVLFWLKWNRFWRSFLSALLMNIASTILGLFVAIPMLTFGFVGVLAAFVVSVFVEGVVLILMKRGGPKQNWIAALLANLASYVLVITPLYFWAQ